MTSAEQVMSAYDWACAVRESKKSGMMLLYCAGEVCRAISEHEQSDQALAAIGELLEDWRGQQRKKREFPCKSLNKAVIVVSAILGVDAATGEPAEA